MAAVAGILLLYISDSLYVIESLLGPGGVNLGFTEHNVVYLVVRNGLVATAVLAAGAVGLGRRRLLVTAGLVAGLHTLFVLGMAVVQLAFGERLDYLLRTAALALCLFAILAAIVLGFVAAARRSRAPRWAGVLIAAAAAAVWSVVWFIGSAAIPVAAAPFILFEVALALLIVLAAGLVGMPSTRWRYAALGMTALLALWQLSRLTDALVVAGQLPGFVALRAALLVAAVVAVFLAARALARTRDAK